MTILTMTMMAVMRESHEHAPVDIEAVVSSSASKTQTWVIPTDEEIVILRGVTAQL
jgi:acetate kinase